MARFARPLAVFAAASAFACTFAFADAGRVAPASRADSVAAARERFVSAREAERRGDAAAALAEYEVAFRLDPNSRDLCFLYLGKLASVGAVDAATETARACQRLARDPASLDVSERKLLGAVALRAGDRAAARAHYRAALDRAGDADDSEALLVLAGLYEEAGDWEAYLGVAEPLLRRLGYPPALLDRIARAYGRLDRPDSALVPLLREAWEATGLPSYGEALLLVYEAQDRPLSLLRVARRLAAENPAPGRDWMLARAYVAADRPDSALAVLERLSRDREIAALPGVRYLRASLLFERGRYKESLKLAAALAREFPEAAAHHLLAGSAALELRDKGARAHLARAFALAPRDAEVRARLAYADYVAGDPARAADRLKADDLSDDLSDDSALRDPDPEARLLLEGYAHGRLARELEPRAAWERRSVFTDSAAARRHRREAVARFEAVLARNSGHPAALFEAGAHHERLGERERAKELLRRLVARDTTHALAMNYLGYMLVEQDSLGPAEREEAGRLLARATALAPENGAYLDSRGWWHYRVGEFDSAVVWLSAAAEAMPGDPAILAHLTQALHALGRRAEACDAWRHLRAIDPAHGGVFLHCAEGAPPARAPKKP